MEPMSRVQAIAAGLAQVRERIAAAEQAAGRTAGSVRLLAVSKKMTADDVRAALAAGQRAFGENYAQELRDKRAALAQDWTLRTLPTLSTPPHPPEWHYIGPLQSNKVKYVAGQVALVHTVDSASLLEAIEARGLSQACLVQVNVAGEAQKRGVAPGQLPALLDRFAALSHVTCAGLMVIPPFTDDPEDARPHFAALRALRDREAARARPNVALGELSMGMSGDLEVAVAEGATIVRVGTAIFGARPPMV
jgi:pyridoxal phosphate enzyme (YggS family)